MKQVLILAVLAAAGFGGWKYYQSRQEAAVENDKQPVASTTPNGTQPPAPTQTPGKTTPPDSSTTPGDDSEDPYPSLDNPATDPATDPDTPDDDPKKPVVTTPEPKGPKFEATFSLELVALSNAAAKFEGKTNLPPGTVLRITFLADTTFLFEGQSIVLRGGKFATRGIRIAPAQVYDVRLQMYSSEQSAAAKTVIGTNGARLSSPFVHVVGDDGGETIRNLLCHSRFTLDGKKFRRKKLTLEPAAP